MIMFQRSAATMLDMTMSRLLLQQPTSYDDENRSVEAILSRGSPVKRLFGTEKLLVSEGSVDLSRVQGGMVPVIDSHNATSISSALGTLRHAWHGDDALQGLIMFNQTPAGRMAQGMVARRELTGVSVGYRVDEWQIEDGEGNIIESNSPRWDWEDDDLIFVGKRWELLEVSLVTTAADRESGFRSGAAVYDQAYYGSKPMHLVADIRARMEARQRMHERMTSFRPHVPGGVLVRDMIPSRDTVFRRLPGQ
jgi:Caudovirus prohead serine protease